MSTPKDKEITFGACFKQVKFVEWLWLPTATFAGLTIGYMTGRPIPRPSMYSGGFLCFTGTMFALYAHGHNRLTGHTK